MEFSEERKQFAIEKLNALPFAKLVGMRLVDIRPNEAVIEIEMRDDLREDERFATVSARNAHRVELRRLMIERLAARDAEDWFELLKAVKVPCAPILGVDEGVRFAEGGGEVGGQVRGQV